MLRRNYLMVSLAAAGSRHVARD